MKKLPYIFILALFGFSQGFTQNIDSLKLALKNAKNDTTKINILSQLSEICEIEDIYLFAEPCIKLCEKAISLNTNPKKYYLIHLAIAINNIGFQEQNQGEIPKALEYYLKSLRIQEKIKDKEGIAISLNNIGLIYNNQGDIPKALEYFHKSLSIQEEINDKEGVSRSLNNIGVIFNTQGNINKALEYFLKSLEIREEIKDNEGIAISLNNIGSSYDDMGETQKALKYYNKSLEIRKEINDKEGVGHSLNNIGAIYNKQNDIPNALEYFQKSLQIREEIKDKAGIANSLINIASAMLKKGDVDEAKNFASRSLQAAKELGFPENIRNAASTLKSIYKKQNNYAAAFEMYELEIQMRDSINNEATKKASIQKQFQYEYEKKAAADSVVFAKENEIKEVEIARQKAEIKVKQNQQLALYGGLLLVLVFAGFMYNRFKITQKQKTVIEQQKAVVEKAHVLLEEKNEEIIASIRYAKRIQDALITSQKYIERNIDRLKQTNKI